MMSNDELIIYIGGMITGLNKYDDNTEYIKGYVKALSDVLEKLKDK